MYYGKIEFLYAYFKGNDGNSLTPEERIKDAVKLLNGKDRIVLDDGKECMTEEELRNALAEHENLEKNK